MWNETIVLLYWCEILFQYIGAMFDILRKGFWQLLNFIRRCRCGSEIFKFSNKIHLFRKNNLLRSYILGNFHFFLQFVMNHLHAQYFFFITRNWKKRHWDCRRNQWKFGNLCKRFEWTIYVNSSFICASCSKSVYCGNSVVKKRVRNYFLNIGRFFQFFQECLLISSPVKQYRVVFEAYKSLHMVTIRPRSDLAEIFSQNKMFFFFIHYRLLIFFIWIL